MGLIKSVAELDFPTKIKILIYGEPGLGKTSAALSMPSPLLFDCDEGIHRVNASFIKATVQPKTYQEILNVLDNEDLSSFRTIVIDGAKKLLDLMEMDIVSSPRAKVDKLVQGNGTLSLRGFGERLRMFEALNKKIAYQNKHVVYVAHQTTTGDSDNLRHVPEFGGSSYAQLATAMDLIGHMEADGNKRILSFSPSSSWDGKNTLELPDTLVIPELTDKDGNVIGENNFMERIVLSAYQNRLDSQKDAAKAYGKLLAELTSRIDKIKTAKQANDFIEFIGTVEHIGSSKAISSRKLYDKAKELGLTFKDGKYE